jgi:glutamine amidotransferase
MLAIDPPRFAAVHGSTDTEVVFQLALTFGLEDDPIGAIEKTVGFIEATAAEHGIQGAVQGTFCTSDGTHLWAVRYATGGKARSLYASTEAETIRRLHPEIERFQQLSDSDRVVVSEPFSDLPGVWREIPQSTAVTVGPGGLFEERPFTPSAPA